MKNNRWLWYVLLSAILLISFLVTSSIGSAGIDAWTALLIMLSKVPFVRNFIDPYWASMAETIIWQVRIPRNLTAILVGGSLAVAGASFQGLLRNPLADPYILGISSGAAAGAAISITITGIVGSAVVGIPMAAFIGAALAMFLVYSLAKIGNRVDVTTLILAGVVVGSFMSAVLSLLLIRMYSNLHQVVFWMMGSLGRSGWERLSWTALLLVFIIIGLCMLARPLNIMSMGDSVAQTLGVATEKIKLLVLVLATLVTALAVSIAGTIGFVGLVVPHVVRLLIGPDHRALLPMSIFVGGIFLLWADTIARTMLSPSEIPVGVVTAFVGAPFFGYLLRKRKKYRI
ncbi:FecCD family ABC transporter permease [Desulfuribacillus alkaliarsenatis]|uniref:Iron ABC transporter n=1 Tax=Desulfuribacillus alkaliarsenatis TaxID=766136 RepID=A0A1E5G4G6_9FIRM|nr:iron chelate uptake ABC transporter family permease subunit [Desulfuribacillus alkaliarsenatis]OEF97983.1 hypothetical protein BHF68_13015 [Desulfuribacillus alkaliarsenatis]